MYFDLVIEAAAKRAGEERKRLELEAKKLEEQAKKAEEIAKLELETAQRLAEEAAEREREKQEEEKRQKEEEERRLEEERLSAERALLSAERSQSPVPMDLDDGSEIAPPDSQVSQIYFPTEAAYSQIGQEPPGHVIQAPPSLYGTTNQGAGAFLLHPEPISTVEAIPIHSQEAPVMEHLQPLVPHPPAIPPPLHKPQIPGLAATLQSPDSTIPTPGSTPVAPGSIPAPGSTPAAPGLSQDPGVSGAQLMEEEQDEGIPIGTLLEGPDIPSVNRQYMIDAGLRKQCRYLVGRLASGNKFTCKYNVLSNKAGACAMKLVFGNEEYTVTAKNLNDAKRNASLKALYYTAYTFQTLPKGLVAPAEITEEPETVEESAQELDTEATPKDDSAENIPEQENEGSEVAKEDSKEGVAKTMEDPQNMKSEGIGKSVKETEDKIWDDIYGKDSEKESEGETEKAKEENKRKEVIKEEEEGIKEEEEIHEEIDDKKAESVIEIDDLEDMDIYEEMMGNTSTENVATEDLPTEDVTEKVEDNVILIESSESENSNDANPVVAKETQAEVGSIIWKISPPPESKPPSLRCISSRPLF